MERQPTGPSSCVFAGLFLPLGPGRLEEVPGAGSAGI